jgi:hypothetical protein
LNRHIVGSIVGALVLSAGLSGQAPATVDFRRDVQPILREHCLGCHGPSQQLSNFRLDRRSDAMRGGNISDIAPGNSAGSRFYLKLLGTQFGLQMPPAGPLPPESIATLKAWVDQGAVWPDDASGEVPPVDADPRAVRLMEALRAGDRPSFETMLEADPGVASHVGAGGSRPLMYAAYYGNAADVERLLDRGADPSLANPTGATALMWAATDLDKVRVLLEYGADVNARSNDGRTALVIAAGQFSNAPVVKLLLDYGAKPSPRLATDLTPLREAARVGDLESFKALVDHGADPKGPGAPPLGFLRANCPACAELVDPNPARLVPPAPAQAAAPSTPSAPVQAAAPSTSVPEGTTSTPARTISMSPAAVRSAVERSLPLLQKTGISFLEKTGCVSCHHNSLVAMAIVTAREQGYRVDEVLAERQTKTVGTYIESWRERSMQGIGIAGAQDSVSYVMLGLEADHFQPNAATDAQAHFLKTRQSPDGRWRLGTRRPPIESSDIEITAVSMRILQAFGPRAKRDEYALAIDRARAWLVASKAENTEDRAFRLLGLAWADGPTDAIAGSVSQLLADQRPDGGWAQLPTMASDAYATGEALVALRRAGGLAAGTPAFKRGAEFLLGSQAEDGSWHVRTRATPIQPYFESGFPYGRDQWISAAATAWATTALALAPR